jgi:mRNA interferase RelE/StbE
MATYRIEVRPAAVRELKRMDRQVQPRIRAAIALLAQNPRPAGAKALKGRDALRVQVGGYRILYQVRDKVLLVVVVTMDYRRDVYRQR